MERNSSGEARVTLEARARDVERIRRAVAEALKTLEGLAGGHMWVGRKAGGDLMTAADEAVNETLRRALPRADEGWLSEETADDLVRVGRRRVWVVDPLDGTQEFVAGIPEWCVSIGLVEDGRPVAGGLCNPATGELFLGSVETGVTLNGRPVRARERRDLRGAEVLASRSEVRRGEWEDTKAPFRVRPVGSVAYKLALVASGLADATWTLSPKHEWDVAGGVALVLAAGGEIRTPGWETPIFNRHEPWLSGLVATSAGLCEAVRTYLSQRIGSAPGTPADAGAPPSRVVPIARS
jgi:myo-inositol-1(or 4)-monophosphatase